MSYSIFGNPFWTTINNVPSIYPWLSYDEFCDVAIIGAGISGAFSAFKFAQAGIDTVVINSTPIAFNSTSINTAILKYDYHNSLIHLSDIIGKQNAIKSFQLCLDSIHNINSIINSMNFNPNFSLSDSLIFSNNKNDFHFFNKEFLMRKYSGFDVDFLDEASSRNIFSFPIYSGIFSKNSAAQLDPYLLSHDLLKNASINNARIFENTSAISINNINNSYIKINTNTNKTITCKKVILATGLEQQNYLDSPISKKTTFSIVTKPIDNFNGYSNKPIISILDNSKISIRTTNDNRIIIRGLDSIPLYYNSKLNKHIFSSKFINNKFLQLEKILDSMFCAIPNIQVDFKFYGTFFDTFDSLPIIGQHNDYPNIFFDFCCGNNGILFSQLATDILLSLYHNQPVDTIPLFSPHRKTI